MHRGPLLDRRARPLPEDILKAPVVVTYHHHHLYEFKTDPLANPENTSASSAMPSPVDNDNVQSNVDHYYCTHVNCHKHTQEPTSVVMTYQVPNETLEIEVKTSTLVTQSAVFGEYDHLHFHHQFVHLHTIYCKQMWLENQEDLSPHRVFFPDLQTQTMTKSGIFVQKGGDEHCKFHHYHEHRHTLKATAQKHPESLRNAGQGPQ